MKNMIIKKIKIEENNEKIEKLFRAKYFKLII